MDPAVPRAPLEVGGHNSSEMIQMTACFLQPGSSAWGGSTGDRGQDFPKKDGGRKSQGDGVCKHLSWGRGKVTGQEKDDGQ